MFFYKIPPPPPFKQSHLTGITWHARESVAVKNDHTLDDWGSANEIKISRGRDKRMFYLVLRSVREGEHSCVCSRWRRGEDVAAQKVGADQTLRQLSVRPLFIAQKSRPQRVIKSGELMEHMAGGRLCLLVISSLWSTAERRMGEHSSCKQPFCLPVIGRRERVRSLSPSPPPPPLTQIGWVYLNTWQMKWMGL